MADQQHQQQQQAAGGPGTGMQCAHPRCSCIVAAGTKYCSQYCSSALDEGSEGCSCGHNGCDTHGK